jgi:flagellar basal body rod protein FlgG
VGETPNCRADPDRSQVAALMKTAAGFVITCTQDLALPEIVQGMIEKSNVEPILEMERMIRVQRAYEQAKQLIDREDERIRKVIAVFVE